MGGSASSSLVVSQDQICEMKPNELFNIQQNTFAHIILLDIRSKNAYIHSHIDLSHHLHFADKLGSNDDESLLYKKWLIQIIKLHQSSYCKAKITFYIIKNDKNDINTVQNVCNWLNKLYHDKYDNIEQIETSIFYDIDYNEYKKLYKFMCSDYKYYEEGRLFPSEITSNIYLSNWGIASDGMLYKILNNIKYVINCTYDHPNIFNMDETDIYYEEFMNEINKYEEKHNEQDPMIKKQNKKIKNLRLQFNDIRLKYIRVPIIDNEDNNIYQYFKMCCDFIQTAIKNSNGKDMILIHCRHGQSRSATITASWLIYDKKMTVDEVLIYIKQRRPRINPNKGFVNQLQKWYNQCNHK